MKSVATHWGNRASGAALAAFLLSQSFAPAAATGTDCLQTDAALNYWRPIHEQAKTSQEPADGLALELTSCLASPNPELRDRIAYELLTYWLRNEKITDDTRRTLLKRLTTTMGQFPPVDSDSAALARSFSALILSELMRSDSNQPFMTDLERQALLDAAVRSLGQEQEYRGLDSELGWVHPVAHMSDLLWRFALHSGTSDTQAAAILAGVRSKVAPTSTFYNFNESDRLARVITTMITRELLAPDTIVAWLASFEQPSSMQKWSDAFSSPQGMAELHNTKLFLRALADQIDGSQVDASISNSLDQLVQGFTQLI